MALAGLRSLRLRLQRGACGLALAIAMLAQGVALPWHLASEHHGPHGHEDLDAHAAHGAHEHPNLPVDHDEDDHEYSSALAASQTRQRASDPSDAGGPIRLTTGVSVELRLRSATRELLARGHRGFLPESVPLRARGARGPPAANGVFGSLCEPV